MKRLFRVSAYVLSIFLCAAFGCHSGMERASLERVQELRKQWTEHPVDSYKLVVDVERDSERRRNEIQVSGGHIAHAELRYWDERSGSWGPVTGLNEAQAYAFTIPGLLETVEVELESGNRPKIWMKTADGPSLVQEFILGQIVRNGEPQPDTAATITIRSFE